MANRMYSGIWEGIKNLPVGTPLQVRVPPAIAKRVIQAVKKEKTREVAVMRKLGERTPGPLVVKQVPERGNSGKLTGFIILEFSLSFDMTKL